MNSRSLIAALALVAPGPVGSGVLHRSRRSTGFDYLPDPAFLIDRNGRVMEVNAAGKELLSSLPEHGQDGSVGRSELFELFSRAGQSELGPAPFKVETAEGVRHYEARFSPVPGGLKAALLADVSLWKRILAERDAAASSARERSVAVCARCGAYREAGVWLDPGSADLAGIPEELRSHGLCPQCLAETLASTEVEETSQRGFGRVIPHAVFSCR